MIQHLSPEKYHQRSEISKHGLDLISRVPALYEHYKNTPQEQTPAMRWGEIIHTIVLEPDVFGDVYVVAPEDLKKTAKKAWAEFEEANAGKKIITFEEAALAQDTSNAIHANQLAKSMLRKIREEGGIENCVFWEIDGIPCRARPDGFSRSMSVAIDLKTCANASKDAFSKDAYNYRYHVQAAFYLDGLRANGVNIDNFVFICVEKSAPYLVSLYLADEEMISLGRANYKRDLQTYAECLQTGIFPGYPTEIQPLSLPSYAK